MRQTLKCGVSLQQGVCPQVIHMQNKSEGFVFVATDGRFMAMVKCSAKTRMPCQVAERSTNATCWQNWTKNCGLKASVCNLPSAFCIEERNPELHAGALIGRSYLSSHRNRTHDLCDIDRPIKSNRNLANQNWNKMPAAASRRIRILGDRQGPAGGMPLA
jgi:hypothetical protein